MKTFKFLIIEDDELARLSLTSMLSRHGLCLEASNSSDAKKLLQKEQFDIVFIDLDLERDLAGLDLIELSSSNGNYTIVLSGREEDTYVEQAYLNGCEDYLAKPFRLSILDSLLKKYLFVSNKDFYRDVLAQKYITRNNSQLREFEKIEEFILSKKPIFLRGATGTGKTLLASLIHEFIEGPDKPFIHLNCSAIPENLLESELFGYKKGAFSGADHDKKGHLELASGGTLFLDEVATMPPVVQKKLLKAIEENQFYPLGSEKLVKSSFRLISATCENLEELVEKKEFREDLYFRIKGFNINLLPLKDRLEDIPLLIRSFIKDGQRRVVFDQEVLQTFKNYTWPGNIRELKKIVEMLQAKSKGIIHVSDLPEEICNKAQKSVSSSKPDVNISSVLESIKTRGLTDVVNEFEERAVVDIFIENDQKVRQTIDALKVSSSVFYRVLNRAKERGLI